MLNEASGNVRLEFLQAGIWSAEGCNFTQRTDGILHGTLTMEDEAIGTIIGDGTMYVSTDWIETNRCSSSPFNYTYRVTLEATYHPALGIITGGKILHEDGTVLFTFDASHQP